MTDEPKTDVDLSKDKTPSLELRRKPEGWYIYNNDNNLSYGPKPEIPQGFVNQPELDEICRVLQISGEEGNNRLKRFLVESIATATIQDPKAGKLFELTHTDRIELEDLTVETLNRERSKRVHPAIGAVDGLAYVGVSLPCLVTIKQKPKKGQQEAEAKMVERDMQFLITSKRQKILLNDEVLSEFGWRLAYQPVPFENRWSIASITRFLEGYEPDPCEVYDVVKNAWQTYMEFVDEGFYDYLTIWTIGTYFIQIFHVFPYVFFGGLKGVGKTKALSIEHLMAFNAVFSGNITTSSLFRLVQSGCCTILMDETEGLDNPERKQDFRSLLLSGYKKGAKVYRTEKIGNDKLVPEGFDPYSPKMVANIQGIEDVLEDRCVTEIIRKGKNKQIIDTEPKEDDPVWQKIRDSLHAFYLSYWGQVKEIYDELSEVSVVSEVCEGLRPEDVNFLSGRSRELWTGILTLAKFFDGFTTTQTPQTTQTTLFNKMVTLAKQKTEEKAIENMTETGDLVLVRTLLEIVKESRHYTTKEIKDHMLTKFDEEEKWINSKWVGRAMKRLHFLNKRRLGAGVEYLLKPAEVQDVAERNNVSIEQREEPEQSKLDVSNMDSTQQQIKVFGFALDEVVGVEFNRQKYLGDCGYCGEKAIIVATVKTFKGKSCFVCENCKQLIDKEIREGETEP